MKSNKYISGKATVLSLTAVALIASFLLGKSLTPVSACWGGWGCPTSTPTPSCTPYNEYAVRSFDGSDKHVNFDFHGGYFQNEEVKITPDAGYTITEVLLDVKGDGIDGYVSYPLEADQDYNPAGYATINGAKAHVTKACPTATPTSSPTASPTPEVSPTPETSPTPEVTDDGDVCHNIDGIQTSVPEGMHLDAGNVNCVNFAVPGEQVGGTSNGQVLGASTVKGQVLGASTMAGTGSFAETLYGAIMGLGAALTSFGIKKTLRKAK